MLPIRFKYLDPIIEKKKKSILRKSKIRNKTKTNRPNQKTDFWLVITQNTDIFQKSCILVPNTSDNNYNMFLQQLQKLLSQNFLVGSKNFVW